MAKVIKYSLITIISLIVLIAIALTAVINFVNPNQFKGQISQQVYNMTGRELTINGNITWTLFPWLSLQVHDVTLNNPQGFSQKTFAKVNEVDIRIKLLPLIEGKFEMGKLVIKNLTLNLIKKANGQTNWQSFSKNNTTNITSEKNANLNSPRQTNKSIKSSNTINKEKQIALNISSIDIQNANVNYLDQKTKQKFAITKLNINSQDIGFNRTFPLEIAFVFSGNQPQLKAQTAINGKININQAEQIYTLSPIEITSTIHSKTFPAGKADFNSSANIVINLKNQTISISQLVERIANMQINGKVKVTNLNQTPQVNAIIVIPNFNPKLLLKTLGVKLPTMQDPNALTSATAKLNITANKNVVNVKNINAQLDHSKLVGNAIYYTNPSETSKFNIRLDKINVSHYLTKAEINKTARQKADTKAKASSSNATTVSKQTNQALAKQTPFAALRKLNMQGHLEVGLLQYQKLKVSDINMQLNARNGDIQVPVTAKLYQGNLNAKLGMNVQGKQPRYAITEKLTNVQALPLSQAYLTDKKFQISGTANVNANLTTSGNSSPEIKRNLKGNTTFNIVNGTLKGVDIGYQLQRVAALIKKRQLSSSEKDNNATSFGDLKGVIEFNNGIANNSSLELVSNAYKVTGNGTVNLLNKALNYHLQVQPIATISPTITEIQKVLGGSIPLLITGTYEKPIPQPDVAAITKATATHYVKKEANKLTQQLEKKLPGLSKSLKKGLNAIFN